MRFLDWCESDWPDISLSTMLCAQMASSNSLLATARGDYARVKEDLADIRSNDTKQSKPPHCGDTKASASRLNVSSKLPRHVHEQAIQTALKRLNIQTRPFLLDDSFASTTVASSQDLLNQISVDVKLSGLRKARETNLIGLIGRLKVAINDVETARLGQLRSERQAMGDVALAAYRELDCSDRRHQVALKTIAAKDAIIAKAELAHKDMEQRLQEKEMNCKAMAEKLEAETDGRINALVSNHRDEMGKLQTVLDAHEKKILEEKEHLQRKLKGAESMIADLEAKCRIHEKGKEAEMAQQKNIIQGLRSKLKTSECALSERDRKIDSLCRKVEDLRARLQDETDQLNAAEAKVRIILEKKEAKIATLLHRAQAAEEELRSLARV